MLTRMTDEDWATVLEVFRACRSRRGAKGRNDRLFLEAVHYFCVHNITWRALPAECGNWNSIWKRFWRLSQTGVFEAFFDALAAMSQTAHLVQMLDSTVVRAHVSAAGAKGGQDGHALGRSRGGFSTKIHLKADLDGRPLAFHLTEGQAGDSPQVEVLLDLGPERLSAPLEYARGAFFSVAAPVLISGRCSRQASCRCGAHRRCCVRSRSARSS